ncbi:MAG: hypothetical protein N3F66_05650 [Spirochaetes bacterium]|nr:hypothetical protein [Spirochaetota bacterium]
MHKYYIVSDNPQIKSAIATLSIADACEQCEDIARLLQTLNDNATIVCDIDYINQLHKHLPEIIQRNIGCVCIYSDTGSINTKTLLQSGIVAAFDISECNYIAAYSEMFTGIAGGSVGIVDSNQANRFGLSTIIKKFGYTAVEYPDLEACCNTADVADILCINCSQVSTESIAKKYIGGMLPKKNAIALYKSDDQDIYIHDIIKLNRIAKVIYTLEEVYVMLVKLLFTQQLHSYIYRLYENSGMHIITTSYRGSLRQWYMEAGTTLFDTPSIVNSEMEDALGDDIRMLERLHARAKAFSWMVSK